MAGSGNRCYTRPPGQVDRSAITLKVALRSWLSFELVTYVWQIVLQDFLGYSVELIAPSLQASHWVEYMQSGEVDMELENWQIDTGHPIYKKFILDEQLADADGIGYNGRSGLFVNTRLLDSEPLADSYRFWQNPSVFRSSDILLYPALNLSLWLGADFPICRPPATLWCNELPGYWMSDLCRAQPEQCALAIHPTPTWDPGYFEQLITNYKLYALVAYVGSGTLTSYVTQQVDQGKNVLFYWYDPDPLISRTQAYRISFPDYAFGCLEKHARNPTGGLTCDYPETTLRKLIRRALRQEAPEAYYSFSRFHMLREDIYSALGSTVQGGGSYSSAFDAACAYVKANEAKILAEVAPPCVSSPLANPQTGDLVFDPSFLDCTAFVAYPELPQPAVTCLSTSKGTVNRGGDVIKLAVRGWLSHRLSTAVVEILLREYLRYDVRLVNASSSDPAGWGPDMAANAFGVDIENDMAAAGSPERIKWVTEQNVVASPLSLGYSRRSAVYVLPHSMLKSPYVDFFRFYAERSQRENTSFYTFSDVNLGSLVGADFPVCKKAVHAWCGTGAFEGWYVPPGCQASPGDCAVIFAATPDQDTGYFEQLTRNLGLRLVHAYLGVKGLKDFVRQAHVDVSATKKDILFHWYEPEPFTTSVGAIRVSFPDHAYGCTLGNTLDPRNGSVACDSGPVRLNKLTRRTLTENLPEAAYLLSRFSLTTEEMQSLMGQHQDSGGSLDTYGSACQFVRSSAAKLERDVVPDCISKPKRLADIRVGDVLFKPAEGVCVEVTCEATNILLVVGDTVICEACPGDRLPDVNQTQCVTCPLGSSPELNKAGKLECTCNAGRRQISTDGPTEVCELCPAGKHANLPKGATSCEDCALGKHSNADGQTQCLNCTAGRSSNQLRTTSCAVCPRGSYQEAEGQTSCSECGVNMVTQFREAASATECVCQEAFYRVDPTSPCMSCPAAMICPPGSEMSNFESWKAGGPREPFPEAHAGYMSLRESPVSVYHCETLDKCPGGPPGTCGPGLDTHSPSCTHCRDGSYWDGDTCATCHRESWLFAVIPWLIGPPIIMVMYCLSRDEVEKWGSWRNCATSMTFLVLNHYQIASVLTGANVKILSGVVDVFKVYEVTEDPLSIFNPSCAGYRTFLDNLALRASLPVILLAMVLLTYVGSHACAFLAGRGRQAFDRNRTVNVYFSFIFTFFVSVCSVVLSTFKCTKNPNGKPTLLVDRSIHCYESEWIGGAVISGVAAFYLIAFGGLFFRAVWQAPACFADRGFRRRWKFLFIKFRPDVWYWALLFCVKSLLLNAGFIFIQEGTFQAYWLMAVLLTYVSLVVSFYPWRHTAANMLDVYRCLALILVIALLISAANTVFDGLVWAATRAVLTVSLSIPVVTALLFAWTVHRQVSSLARHGFESKMRTLFQSMKEFSNAPDDDMLRFVWKLDETARWHIANTMRILGAELSGLAHPKKKRLIAEAAPSWYSCNSNKSSSTATHSYDRI